MVEHLLFIIVAKLRIGRLQSGLTMTVAKISPGIASNRNVSKASSDMRPSKYKFSTRTKTHNTLRAHSGVTRLSFAPICMTHPHTKQG